MNPADINSIVDGPITAIIGTEANSQFAESAKLELAIKANLRGLGYGG